MHWLQYNFPHQQNHDPLLGLAEEVGELCHAHLKLQQGIRGSVLEHRAAAEDAIGDIVIYLISYCNSNKYVLEDCLQDAWARVKRRDWVKDPVTGGEGEHADQPRLSG